MLSTDTELKPLSDEVIESLREAAGDPIDAMRLAADVYATSAYLAECARAIETGGPRPKRPNPISRYVRTFTLDLNARLVEIGAHLGADAVSRLDALKDVIAKRLDDNDGELVATLLLLAAMHPQDAASWIRRHMHQIEERYSS